MLYGQVDRETGDRTLIAGSSEYVPPDTLEAIPGMVLTTRAPALEVGGQLAAGTTPEAPPMMSGTMPPQQLYSQPIQLPVSAPAVSPALAPVTALAPAALVAPVAPAAIVAPVTPPPASPPAAPATGAFMATSSIDSMGNQVASLPVATAMVHTPDGVFLEGPWGRLPMVQDYKAGVGDVPATWVAQEISVNTWDGSGYGGGDPRTAGHIFVQVPDNIRHIDEGDPTVVISGGVAYKGGASPIANVGDELIPTGKVIGVADAGAKDLIAGQVGYRAATEAEAVSLSAERDAQLAAARQRQQQASMLEQSNLHPAGAGTVPLPTIIQSGSQPTGAVPTTPPAVTPKAGSITLGSVTFGTSEMLIAGAILLALLAMRKKGVA